MNGYSREEMIDTLTVRMEWYKKACKMKSKEIPYENGFDFPPGNILGWEGAYVELKNTISMLKYGYDAMK